MAETMRDGIDLYRSGNYTDALTLFLSLPAPDAQSFDEGSGGFDLAYYIGLCYARLERYDEAVLYLEQVVTGGTVPQRVNQCRFALAVIYSLTGRSRLADFELQQLIAGGYKSAQVYAALAYVEWGKKETSKAVEYYEKALELNPNSPTALNGLGYVLACEDKDLTKALSYCKKRLLLHRTPQLALILWAGFITNWEYMRTQKNILKWLKNWIKTMSLLPNT